ncbi:adenosine deaminase cecr1 [Plakobranchus ocellatus]|uniref:adenosine deaminase n=1 Tax=Plakobranchus ocellatus TaxID=259542 RepID=A0AAV3YSY1_9GAST|nr:adenosine deaminase cecr1 [Plakobranchus ocellatus]
MPSESNSPRVAIPSSGRSLIAGQFVMTLLAIAMSLVAMLAGITNGIPQAYLDRRKEFIREETSMRLGADMKLNFREELVNHYLMVQKELAVEASRLTTEPYLASRHFFQVKEQIESTAIFDIISMMPKGGILHLHDASIVPLDWVIKTLTYLPDLYTKEREGITPRQFKFSKTPLRVTDGWRNVSELRAEMAMSDKNRSLDEVFMSEWSLYTPDPYNTYKSSNDMWNKFSDYFLTIPGLRSTLETAEMYLREALKGFYADGVMYVELRDGDLFDGDGLDLTDDYMCLVDRVVKDFQKTHPDFMGVKFILTGYRFFSEPMMQEQVDKVMARMRKFPDLVKGFDMDSHEDINHRIRFYLNALIKDDKSVMPFFFHAGETAWTQGADMNLVDAVLLNATRIGHGFAALKHPKVMQAIRDQGIVLEIQPISNQVLGLVDDQRNHPAASFIANNDRLVISSDDFALWDALPLSHDFYITFMGLGATKDDLRLLKKLAMNSIEYSTMTSAEKAVAMKIWQRRWKIFIDDVLTKYHLL